MEREAELRAIRSAVEGAATGAGALLVIEGPAGIGKSRLLSDACGQVKHAGLQVLRARGGVLGERASLDQASSLAAQDEPAPAVALDRLAAPEILAPALPLDFVHPIVREVVYGQLGLAQRARWHAGAAELVLAAGGPIERAARICCRLRARAAPRPSKSRPA